MGQHLLTSWAYIGHWSFNQMVGPVPVFPSILDTSLELLSLPRGGYLVNTWLIQGIKNLDASKSMTIWLEMKVLVKVFLAGALATITPDAQGVNCCPQTDNKGVFGCVKSSRSQVFKIPRHFKVHAPSVKPPKHTKRCAPECYTKFDGHWRATPMKSKQYSVYPGNNPAFVSFPI